MTVGEGRRFYIMKSRQKIKIFLFIIAVNILTGCRDSIIQEEEITSNQVNIIERTDEKNIGREEIVPDLTEVEASDKKETIPYAGESFQKSVFAVGGNMIYVCGVKTNGDMFLGCMQQEDSVFQEFRVEMEEDMRAFNMVIDCQNNCHILWMKVEECVLGEEKLNRITYEKSYITIVSKEGKLISKIDVSDIFQAEQKRPFCFIVDREGKYYFENENKLIILSEDGIGKETVFCEGRIEGIGIGKSGTVYCTYEKEGGRSGLAKLQEGIMYTCDAELPDSNAIYAGIYPGIDSELMLFNKESGVLSFDGSMVKERISDVDLPVRGEKIAGYGMLSDGRICILVQEKEDNTFYYIPSGK